MAIFFFNFHFGYNFIASVNFVPLITGIIHSSSKYQPANLQSALSSKIGKFSEISLALIVCF